MNSNEDIWKKVLEMLSEKLTETTVSTWFDEVTLISLTEDSIALHTPVEFKRDIIVKRYKDNIAEALRDIFSTDFQVDIYCTENTRPKREPAKSERVGVQESLTFENFVVGPSNSFAFAAARYVAEHPGGAYNPMFIYGESGLGKTHLLNAVCNTVREVFPEYSIVYVRSDEFTNELIASIGAGTNAQFREKYRRADILLMDDVQFIAGKTQTQEEFFHTFNTLYEAGKQIILTSDRPPKDMARLESRLQTRFEWGLLADIQPPDYETRMVIVERKALATGLELSPKDIAYIAENISHNVRQIEGTVNKILAYRQLGDESFAKNAVKRAVDDLKSDHSDNSPPPELICEEVSRFFSISNEELMSKKRTAEIANSRQYAMYLMRQLTNMSFQDIGRFFGGKDHTTVMHAVDKIDTLLRSEKFTKDTIRDVKANIKARM